MNTILAILLVQLIVVLVVAVFYLRRLIMAVGVNTEEVRELRLTSRTRISEVSVRSGAVTDEMVMRRLGRASVGRRVVVGGDPGSQLNKDLTTLEERETDHD
jgi:hypothetical protein